MKRDYKQELYLFLSSLSLTIICEYKFHPKRKWRADFYIPEYNLLIEYEGMPYQIAKSRHTTIRGYRNDAEKYNEAALLGFRLLRYTAQMIADGTAYSQIESLIKFKREGL